MVCVNSVQIISMLAGFVLLAAIFPSVAMRTGNVKLVGNFIEAPKVCVRHGLVALV